MAAPSEIRPRFPAACLAAACLAAACVAPDHAAPRPGPPAGDAAPPAPAREAVADRSARRATPSAPSLQASEADGAGPAHDDWRGEETPWQGDPWLVGLSPSFLPNLGLTATLAREVGTWRGGGLALELELTEQFLDDTSFTDSSNPPAGDWSQGKLGLRWSLPYDRGRWFTLRTGGVLFRARGKPNIINDPGDYAGVFVELGLEARLGRHLIVGPAVSTMLAYDETDHQEHVIPQVTWRILYVL